MPLRFSGAAIRGVLGKKLPRPLRRALRTAAAPLAGLVLGALLGGWFGAILCALISLLLSELSLRALRSLVYARFFAAPLSSAARLGDLEPFPGAAALIGLALSLEPESVDGSGAQGEAEISFSQKKKNLERLEAAVAGRAPAAHGEAWLLGIMEEAGLRSIGASASGPGDFLEAYARSGGPKELAAEVAFSMAADKAENGANCLPERVEALLAAHGYPVEISRSVGGIHFKGWISAWELLGLCPGSGRDELKKAYRALSLSFHPDGLSSLSREKREMAQGAFVRINAAYVALEAILPGNPYPPGG
jgi:hypothetical protein